MALIGESNGSIQATSAAVGNTVLAFVTFMPSPDELLSGQIEIRHRVNEAAAVSVSLGVGLLLSFATGNAGPFVFSLVITAAMVGATEWLMHCNSEALTTERKMI